MEPGSSISKSPDSVTQKLIRAGLMYFFPGISSIRIQMFSFPSPVPLYEIFPAVVLSSSLRQFVTVFGIVECGAGLTLNVTLVCVSGPSSSSFTPSDSLSFLGSSSVDGSERARSQN